MEKCIKSYKKESDTTFSANDLLLIVTLILFLLSDSVDSIWFEIIWIISTIVLIAKNYKNYRRYRNSGIARIILIFNISVLIMFALHLAVGSLRPENVIRFYGLTKCTIMPCIMFYCFYKNNRFIYLWRTILVFLICLNIAFFYVHIIVRESDAAIEGFGSVNAIGGLNVIVLPLVLYRAVKNRDGIEKILNLILISQIVINAILFDATTYKYLFYGFTVLLVLSLLIKSEKIKRIYCFLVGLAVLCLVILPIVLVITKVLPTDFFLYQSRGIIWEEAYRQFCELPLIEQILGSGNNIVVMEIGPMQAHNFTMEILMTYGWVGIPFLFLLFCGIVGCATRFKLSTKCIFLTTLLLYTVVSFMNPFFTGLTYYQIISWATILGFMNFRKIRRKG